MFMVLSSWPKSLLQEFTRFIWWMQTERRVAANPQTKPIDLGCESAENWQLSSTSTIAIVIITQPVGWYSFYRSTKGGRLSRPKHCSKGAQPVLKTVYRSSCRDKHNFRRPMNTSCNWVDLFRSVQFSSCAVNNLLCCETRDHAGLVHRLVHVSVYVPDFAGRPTKLYTAWGTGVWTTCPELLRSRTLVGNRALGVRHHTTHRSGLQNPHTDWEC